MPLTEPYGSLFDPSADYNEGDVFYGISGPRNQMSSRAVASFRAKYGRAPVATSMDELNNEFIGTGFGPAGLDAKEQAVVHKIGRLASSASPLAKTAAGKEWSAAHEKFLLSVQKLGGDKVFSADIITGADDVPESKVSLQDDASRSRFKRVKRSCKYGVFFITVYMQSRVNFILNKMDMQDVVSKGQYKMKQAQELADKKAAVPDALLSNEAVRHFITSKELRWVCRNWHDPDVSRRVLFWLQKGNDNVAEFRHFLGVDGEALYTRLKIGDIVRVPAPWECDLKLWSQYKPHGGSWHLLPSSPLKILPRDKELLLLTQVAKAKMAHPSLAEVERNVRAQILRSNMQQALDAKEML